MDANPDALVGRWVHSWEEDSGDVRTYRRAGFAFPLSRRPRHIIELMADGSFESRSGGPADARVVRDGRWEARDLVLLTLHWEPPEETVLEIAEQPEDLLKLRPLRGIFD
jgi:hypothetical protein